MLCSQHRFNYPTPDVAVQPIQNFGAPTTYPYPTAGTDARFDNQLSNLLATNVLQMAHDVGESLLQTRSEKTEVFSPLSIYGALSLLLLGSSGQTYQELLSVMGLNKGELSSSLRCPTTKIYFSLPSPVQIKL